MLRIAHISDLHIRHPDMNNDEESILQKVASAVGEALGLKVEAGGHSPEKLNALNNILSTLKPDLIVVTGDITNFGDKKSFEMASDYLGTLKKTSGARRILCVPGNHDCLVERAAQIQLNPKGSWMIRALARISREVELLIRPESGTLRDDVSQQLDGANGLTLLRNYEDWCAVNEFAEVDPSNPVIEDAGWGKAALFLFNSVNDPGLMANKGRIGQAQFNLLNQCLQNPEKMGECLNAVRIALLHHHPISAPQSLDQDVNRFYDWMHDGPLALQYLNKQGFHFILHGHQHEPFHCTVNYLETSGGALHIMAAGSASQGAIEPHNNSFNLIDLLTPFEARLRRFTYSTTGYDDKSPAIDLVLPVRPIAEVRVTSSGPETVEDWAMRELVKGCYEDAYDIDAKHQYDLLEYSVSVTKTQTYKGEYRRKGRVVGKEASDGLVFVITGSPAMKVEQMKLKATNNLNGKPLQTEILRDLSHQKVIRVLSRLLMKPEFDFDVTLKFEWHATESEPNDFDGVNLMPFRHPVGHLKYKATLPWEPAQARVLAYGVQDFTPTLQNEALTGSASTNFEYSFEIADPKPMAYLISFRP
ncbi:MAG: metallophosphoesterase family protein [Pyrinomonadaceae bacterium]